MIVCSRCECDSLVRVFVSLSKVVMVREDRVMVSVIEVFLSRLGRNLCSNMGRC